MQPLHEAVARATERPVAEKRHLHRAKTPSRALGDIFRQALGGKADAQTFIQPVRLEPPRHQLVREVDVLADGAVRKAADQVETVPPHDERRADAKGASPGVFRRLENIEEDALIVDPGLSGRQIVLNRIGVVEKLWGLDDRGLGIGEQADHAPQNGPARREIGIEHEDQGRVGQGGGVPKTVVEIACLRGLVVRTRDVAGSDALAVVLEPAAPGVVEHPYGEVGIVDRKSRNDGFLDHVERLVVGADEDIDRRPSARFGQDRLGAIGLCRAVGPAHENQNRQQCVDDGDGLERKEQPRPEAGYRPLERRDGVEPPPGRIGDDHRRRDDAEDQTGRKIVARQKFGE